MKKIFLYLLMTFHLSIVSSQPGMTPDRRGDVEHYEFNLSLSDTSDVIYCETRITVRFREPMQEFRIDLDNVRSDGKGMLVSSLLCNGKEAVWEHSGNKVILRDCSPGISEIVISYSGIPSDGLIISKNRFGNRTFFADHWPDRASAYLPVVDHPSDKAAVDFIIMAPSHYEVVGSGELVEESDMPGGLKLTHWKEVCPLAVKVMAFAAADFAVQLAGRVDSVPVWSWVYPENREEGFYDYSVALKPVRFYSELIGPYPYSKLTNVQSKTIFGGLENAGCIFYSERSVTGEGKAEKLIAHEIAHQWFGNSVTEGDWHHVWLSEGFATYLTSVYEEMNYGKERLAENMAADRSRVLRNSERTARPVIDTTIKNLMQLLNTNSYQKGAWVLHMLRDEVGEESFWKGMQHYYEKFRNGNAVTDDFKKTMEEASGKDLDIFFRQWLYVAGEPELKISLVPQKKNDYSEIVVEQLQDHIFSFRLTILIKDQGKETKVVMPVTEKKSVLTVKASPDAVMTVDPEVRLLYRAAGIK